MNHVHASFPDDFLSNEEKHSPEYGLEVGKAIDNQWFQGQLGYRRQWIDKMRAYARGEQTTDYKSMIEGSNKKKKNPKTDSFKQKNYKIDYTETLKILPVFKDILTNAIDESLFKPKAEAIDISAINQKKDYFKNLEESFYTSDFAKIISEGIGVDITASNAPKTLKELQMKKLDYKPRIEIAQELAIENVFKHQKFETIKDKVDEDLVDLGIGVAKQYTDYKEGIKHKYIDVYNYIHSQFEIDDGRDIRYHGYVERTTIGDLMKMSGKTFSEDELLSLKRASIGNNDITEAYDHDTDAHRLIEYITFEYAVHKSRIFKKLRKNKSIKLIDRSKKGYSPSNRNKKIEIPLKVWYEGIYVPTAQVLLKWNPIPNQVEKELNNPISNFVVYAPKVKRISEKGLIRFDSLVQRSIPIVDDIHRDWYKFQQLKMELRPNTVAISPRALNNVILNGTRVHPQDVLGLFFGRGILLGDDVDEDGEPIGRSIREENGGVNNTAITLLSNEFSNNYDRLRQLLGINELRDGTTTPNSKTAVTVQKLLLASSNNATNHIVKASFNISLRMAEITSLRLYDVLTTKALKERYMSIIGSDNVDLLDEIKELPAHKFAVYFDFKPDNEERIAYEQSLINAFNNGKISSSQYNRARQIRNTKSAIKFLEYSELENQKKEQELKIQNIEAQANANAKTSILTEKTKQETITISFEKEKQLLLLKDQLETKKRKREALTKDILDQRQHERKKEIVIIETSKDIEKEELKEDRKDARVTQQSENQSKLIEKRADVSKEISFEPTTNDSFQGTLKEIFNE